MNANCLWYRKYKYYIDKKYKSSTFLKKIKTLNKLEFLLMKYYFLSALAFSILA